MMRFNAKTTGLSMYDEMLADPQYFIENKNKKFEIVMMTPMEYITKCAKMFGDSVTRVIATRQKNLEKLKEKEDSVVAWNMPLLDYTGNESQEGITRCLLAMDRGVTKIPVMVITAYDPTQRTWY